MTASKLLHTVALGGEYFDVEAWDGFEEILHRMISQKNVGDAVPGVPQIRKTYAETNCRGGYYPPFYYWILRGVRSRFVRTEPRGRVAREILPCWVKGKALAVSKGRAFGQLVRIASSIVRCSRGMRKRFISLNMR